MKKGGEIMNKIATSLMLFMPMVAKAQTVDPFGVNDLTGTELGTKSLEDTISGIINIVLGFLGIIATIIILYGGFKWMTSQGSTDKVDEAKKLIGAGVVGLVIVLASYAIARYVLSSAYNETVI